MESCKTTEQNPYYPLLTMTFQQMSITSPFNIFDHCFSTVFSLLNHQCPYQAVIVMMV